jgi:hypothetical protein
VFAALLSALTACGDDDQGRADDSDAAAGRGGDSDASPMDSGPWTPPPPLDGGTTVECPGVDDEDTVTCMGQIGIAACCLPDGGCGTMTPIGKGCVPLDNPGGLDPSCEPVTAGGFELPGCCAPGGRCGGLGTFSGCVPRELLAGDPPPASCDYDADNNCTGMHELSVCDGNEDCGAGLTCAADFTGGRYSNYRCTDSLIEEDALAASMMGAVSQICHPGDECEVEGYQCLVNPMYQPTFAGRCRDTGDPVTDGPSGAGEINCAEDVCDAATQKCCVPITAEGTQVDAAYCIDRDEDCACSPPQSPPDAGAPDAGGQDTDSGTDDQDGGE